MIKIYKLRELMKRMSKEKLSVLLFGFKCSRNRDSEHFLRKIAVKHEERDISRTYLAMDFDENNILGYFTLALKCLNLKASEVDAELAEMLNLNNDIAQSYMIGQLARSDDAERGLGRDMLHRALKNFSVGKKMFGCRTVRLDCKDELIGYYMSQGFIHIRKNPDRDLNQMARFI